MSLSYRWRLGKEFLVLILLVVCMSSFAKDGGPITLHPENQHYFLYQGKPTVLITSGEHYGAVLNLDFDYVRYLKELQRNKLNLTRTFSGTYKELPGSFGITDNTLAPRPSRYITPWGRSSMPGGADGGNRFDLHQWDPAYFNRLKEFMTEAARRGVVVEFTLFCTLYEDALWQVSPMNTASNINGVGACPRQEVFRLMHEDLTNAQTALVRKMARELRDVDNVFYEVCNEPYMEDCVSDEWQRRMVETLVDEEKKLGVRHLISMNIANGCAKVEKPVPDVSVFNFHYSNPPDTVAMNWHLNKVIGENETGFRGKEDVLYRTEGWDVILAGGALYNSLDWSFMTSHPEGDLADYQSPGGGSRELRRQMGILKSFINGFDFVRMSPAPSLVQDVSPELSVQALAEAGNAYALYLHAPNPEKGRDKETCAAMSIMLPAGQYGVQWVDPRTGTTVAKEKVKHNGGLYHLRSPSFDKDIALSIRRS